jgi:ABC-type amino acid transport substrate-binding protein
VLIQTFDNTYDKDKLIANMALMHDRVPDKVHHKGQYVSSSQRHDGSRLDAMFKNAAKGDENNETQLRMLYGHVPAGSRKAQPSLGSSVEAGSRLKMILETGVLRICYNADDVPFSYFNNSGELVGLDIELFNILAHDMKVSLEMVPTTWKTITRQLNDGECDIGTGQGMTPEVALNGAFSTPIMDRTVAFLVKDFKRADFSTSEAVHNLKAPRLGIVDVPYFIDFVHDWLPHAELVTVNSPREFIEKFGDELDAYITTVEKAGAWSLLRPEYSVAIPVPDVMKFAAAFPIPHGEESLADFLKIWITIKQKDQTIQKAYDYWVLGKQFKKKQPRWSVIRDVLHWVD